MDNINNRVDNSYDVNKRIDNLYDINTQIDNVSKTVDNSYNTNIFDPSSIILTNLENVLLNNQNTYKLKFNTGMVDGSGSKLMNKESIFCLRIVEHINLNLMEL